MKKKTTKTKGTKQPKPWHDLPIHQAAELTPLMTPEQLRELADDIKKNGLREPISISEGDGHDLKFGKKYLMDGRNRMNALALLGIDVFHYKIKRGKKTEEIDWHREITCGDVTSRIFKIEDVSDPGAFVKSKNLHRLHLNSAEQRRELLLRRLKANPELSNRQIAVATGVDHTTVAAARKKVEATGGIPQLEKTKGKDGKARPARKKTAKDGKKTPKPTESAEQPAPDTSAAVEQAANPPPEASAAERTAYYAEHEDGGAELPAEASTETRKVIMAALGDIGAGAIARVMAFMAQQVLPRTDLQLIIDHDSVDERVDERAELIERLRRVGAEHFAWADRLANSLPQPPTPTKAAEPTKASEPKEEARKTLSKEHQEVAVVKAVNKAAKGWQLKRHENSWVRLLNGKTIESALKGVDYEFVNPFGLAVAIGLDVDAIIEDAAAKEPKPGEADQPAVTEPESPVRDESSKKTEKAPALEFFVVIENHRIGYEASVGDAHSFRIEVLLGNNKVSDREIATHTIDELSEWHINDHRNRHWQVLLRPERKVVAYKGHSIYGAIRAAKKYFAGHPELWPMANKPKAADQPAAVTEPESSTKAVEAAADDLRIPQFMDRTRDDAVPDKKNLH